MLHAQNWGGADRWISTLTHCNPGCVQARSELYILIRLSVRRSRGLDQQTARQMLVYSFGKEVTQHLGLPQLQARIEGAVNATLAKAPIAVDEDESM